jgi:hypothetical protein
MVDEMNLQLNEVDLRDVQRQVQSKMSKVNPGV